MRSELMREYTALRERWKSAEHGIKVHDIPQLKLSLQCAREFLERWQHKRDELAIERTLAELRDQNRRIVAVLESWFLEALHRVIDRRVRWLIAEHRFRFSVEYIRIVQNARCDLQAQLAVFFWDEFGCEFQAERLYRQSEAAADRSERDYKRALSALKSDWPELVNVELCRRLSATDPRQLRKWKATLPMQSLSGWKFTL
jgi:hypothetical protein